MPAIRLSGSFRFFFLLSALFFSSLLSGCSSNLTSSPNGSNSTTGTNAGSDSGAQNVQVFVEPSAGVKPFLDAIGKAQKSVWVEIYLLTDRNVVRALEEAANRGLDVRVMLEAHPYGSGPVSPAQTMDKLQASGVKVKATNPNFSLTHAKCMITDSSTAYIMTSNFTLSALGGSNNSRNREYDIADSNPQDVQSVLDIFNADWQRSDPNLNDPNLVVSPTNSRTSFTSLIASAQKSLIVEAEEMQDTEIQRDLVEAARRGVQVQVILPEPQQGRDSNASGVSAIRGGGVQVRLDPTLYMHAKMMVADNHQAFVGSENISTASLDHNREVGLLISNTDVITTLQQTFQQDWSDSANS